MIGLEKGGQGMRFLRRFERVWDRINDAIMVLAGILLWVQMLIVNIEVFSRYFGHPTSWVAEISSILILWVPFMVTGWVLRKDAHVKMDLLVERLSPRAQAMINFITSLAGVVVMLIVAAAGLMTAIYWIGNKTPTMLMLPRTPIIGIIFVGSLLFAVQFLIRAQENLELWREHKVKQKKPLEASDLSYSA
jgi:TRAP-type C4-dicarboxylate transport system permease small subunit